jgi:tripartite-type tricarboxylate transporter receptor subunit TctC
MKKIVGSNRGGIERREFIKLMATVGGASMLGSLPISSHAAAKEIYPAKDITFICYSAPGGSYDLTARSSGPFLTKALKEVSKGAKGGNIQVKNMTGGNGTKAALYLYNDARPDGYTIGDLNRASYFKFQMTKDKLPFDVMDFTYLYSLTTTHRVLISGKNSGITSWETMITRSKKEPLRWAISSVGGSEHLDTIYVMETTKIPGKMTIWGSASQTESALIRGDADVTLVAYDFIGPLIESKEVNLLISFTNHRIEPNTPTIAEKGFPRIAENVGGTGGKIVIAPPNLDPEVKNILIAAARKMVVDPGFIDVFNKGGTELTPLFGREVEDYFKSKIKFLKEMAPIYKKYDL